MPSRRSLPDPRPHARAGRAARRPAARLPGRSTSPAPTARARRPRMTTALLGAKGLTVGTYTSPNLARVNERLSRDGEPIDDDALAEVLGALAAPRADAHRAAHPLRAADRGRLALVRRRGGGRGGGRGGARAARWDATNVVDAEVAVRHQRQLRPHRGPRADPGGHRPRQGRASSSPGATVVVGETDPELWWPSSGRWPTRPGPARSGCAARSSTAPPTGWPSAVGWSTCGRRAVTTPSCCVPLHGAHQGRNAACALAAAEAFFGAPRRGGGGGRRSPRCACPGGWRWSAVSRSCLVDGAHNVAGAEALAAGADRGASRSTARPVVGGRHARRAATRRPCCAPLRPAGVDTVVACAPPSPRALPAEVVAEAARALGLAAAGGRRRSARRSRWPGRWCRPTGCWWSPARSTWWPTPGRCWWTGPRPARPRRPPDSGSRPPCYGPALVNRTLGDLQARRRRAGPGRRDRRPARAQRPAAGGRRAAHHRRGGGRAPLRRARGQALLRRPGGLHHPVAGAGRSWSRARRGDLADRADPDGPDQPGRGRPRAPSGAIWPSS